METLKFPAGTVVSLQLCLRHEEPLRPTDRVVAIPGAGLEGDVHGTDGRGSPRQVLLIDTTTLDSLGLRPGDLREQVTLDLPRLQALPPGTRLRIGEATFELTGPCAPCGHIGELLGAEDVEAFRESLSGRRGVLARVVEAEGEGRIRVGDPVDVVIPTTGGRT